jgi:hypothetical protein
MCTAGNSAHEGDMLWTSISLKGNDTYLIGPNMSANPKIRANIINIVKVTPDLRKELLKADPDGRPPTVGYEVRTSTITAKPRARVRANGALHALPYNAQPKHERHTRVHPRLHTAAAAVHATPDINPFFGSVP